MTCDLPVIYDDDRWTHIVTQAEEDCVAFMSGLNLPQSQRLLDVGVGASYCYEQLCSHFDIIEGLAVMDSELILATTKQGPAFYKVHKINKYDPVQLNTLGKYNLIIDVNPKMFSCCEEHWTEYLLGILRHLEPGGQFVTHTAGFGCYEAADKKVHCGPLSIQDLLLPVTSLGMSILVVHSTLIHNHMIVSIRCPNV